ncbi:hypothetical protein FM113_00155 [Leucobacter sp. 7(1)]|nr:hypothetical protein FM113_00155 [Leucobacter sp. 7(1)]
MIRPVWIGSRVSERFIALAEIIFRFLRSTVLTLLQVDIFGMFRAFSNIGIDRATGVVGTLRLENLGVFRTVGN